MEAFSLYSGAGGMDVGFRMAGFHTVLACESNRVAAATLAVNFPETDVRACKVSEVAWSALRPRAVPMMFGGPPCQGYSVAGNMDAADPRSAEVFSFVAAVDASRPLAWVMENVDALANSRRWSGVLASIRSAAAEAGYATHVEVLDASMFGVPQARKRMFMFGSAVRDADGLSGACGRFLRNTALRRPGGTVRQALSGLDPVGMPRNPLTCTAVIRFASNPVVRRSPYAGMLFNGAGRALDLEAASLTVAASSGGNKTHVVDEAALRDGERPFIEGYHAHLLAGGRPFRGDAPDRLRRLTVRETMALQGFPADHVLVGAKSACYRQLGNAVPPLLAHVAAWCGRVAMGECPDAAAAQAG